jgi:hypothetical protein
MARKNPATVVLGRKARKKGGRVRTAKLTREQRSKSARQKEQVPSLDNSDQALATLLDRLRASVDPAEIRQLSDQIERIVFHRQFANA